MLTGKEILEQEIITNVNEEKQIQQVGVDLQIISISSIVGVGMIPAKSKTILPAFNKIEPVEEEIFSKLFTGLGKGWFLEPGYYQITLDQGCNVPANRVLLLKERSSLSRCGTIICSGVYDPGFKTDKVGSSILVSKPIYIEYGARVCQALVYTCNEVLHLYKGQFQGDKQRDK